MMVYLLQYPFAQHALIAATLVAITCGLIGPFVITRKMSFAVHGSSELAFTGAAFGLLVFNNGVIGAFIGAAVVATLFGVMGNRESERDSSIGVILAAGTGLGIFLLGLLHGYVTAATNILFGDIFGVSYQQILILLGMGLLCATAMAFVYRPLLFASVDPDVALAKGVPTKLLGIAFLFILAFTVTGAAQVVGTLLVLSLAVTPAAAAQRVVTGPIAVGVTSILLALFAADGGLLLSLQFPNIKPSVLIVGLSFGSYLVCRAIGPFVLDRNRHDPVPLAS
jgi:zinc/manganese transport system permease protein